MWVNMSRANKKQGESMQRLWQVMTMMSCLMMTTNARSFQDVIQVKEEASKEEQKSEREIYQWMQTYAEVLSLLEKKSFRMVPFSKFIQNSLKSAVAEVDAHSAFFTRKSYKAAMETTTGEFSGIGVSIISKTPEDEVLTIIDVVHGGPAEKIGIQAGDKIFSINEKKIKGLSTDEVVTKLKGKVGSKLHMRVIRNKKPRDFVLTRDIIKDQTSFCYKFKNQNIYYLSLKIFNQIAVQQMEDLLKIANEGRCRGIVLDLRRNPGGTLDSVIDIAGFFTQKDSLVVTTKNKKREVMMEYRTKRDRIFKSDVPIFMLVDNFTASAAEILAGALRYHSEHQENSDKLNVFLLGTPTFGKGSVQELIPIKNGCALKLTTMLYFLPDQTSLQAVGITPDFFVQPKLIPSKEIKMVKELYGTEASLQHHITQEEALHEGKAKKKKKDKKEKGSFWRRLFGRKGKVADEGDDVDSNEEFKDNGSDEEGADKKNWEEKQQELLSTDAQVQACVNMINLYNLAKRLQPELLNSRKKALAFLQEQYLTDNGAVVEKIR